MVKVAVAGGTGNLGRALVEEIKNSPHETIILSRKEDAALSADIGVPIVAIDYSDVKSATKVLESNGVHTVVSAVLMVLPEMNDVQLNLIKAAEKSKPTKRFIPSEFGVPWSQKLAEIFPPQVFRHNAILALKETSLEFTSFNCGLFMDYFGVPNIKSNIQEFNIVIDVPHRFAALPGDGNNTTVFTYTYDIGKYLAKYLSIPDGQWDESVYVVGDAKTWNEALQIVEKVVGEKFEVVYDSKEKLDKGETTPLPSWTADGTTYKGLPLEMIINISARLKNVFVHDGFDLEATTGIKLNERYPDIKPKTVQEIVEWGWGKK